MTNHWQPSASIATLKQRARFIGKIRQFFELRDVMEVETPLLSQGTVTDVHLDAFVTEFLHHNSGDDKSLYLQTSPEFAMKRLLAAGSGPIFQICKAFRNEAAGRLHNPEFTMLEWYRPGFDEHALMTELDALLQTLLSTPQAEKVSYQQAFLQCLNLDPLSIDLPSLKAFVAERSDDAWLQQESSKDTLLQWLFSLYVEPQLGAHGDTLVPCFVYDFPASQSSLAKINQANPKVAHRFELYFNGMELANGFYELQDAKEQARRFKQDNQLRVQNGQAARPVDKRFLGALEAGLPDCAGVAVGVDRLFMLASGKTQIHQVLSFGIENA